MAPGSPPPSPPSMLDEMFAKTIDPSVIMVSVSGDNRFDNLVIARYKQPANVVTSPPANQSSRGRNSFRSNNSETYGVKVATDRAYEVGPPRGNSVAQ